MQGVELGEGKHLAQSQVMNKGLQSQACLTSRSLLSLCIKLLCGEEDESGQEKEVQQRGGEEKEGKGRTEGHLQLPQVALRV